MDVYNVSKQGQVWEIKNALKNIQGRRGAAIRERVKWNKVGNKFSAKFFNVVKQKNNMTIIMKL